MGNTVPEKKGEEKKKPLSRWEGREEFASTPSPECLAPANKEMSFPKLKSYTAPGNTLGFQPSHPPSRPGALAAGTTPGPRSSRCPGPAESPPRRQHAGVGAPRMHPTHTPHLHIGGVWGRGGPQAQGGRDASPAPRFCLCRTSSPPPFPRGFQVRGGGGWL